MNDDNKRTKLVVKASLMYTIGNVISKGMSFITVPIFTRLLSTIEYGYYSNYATWLSLLSCIVTLSLYSSLGSARFDFEEDLYDYIFSILILGIFTTVFITIIFVIWNDFFENIFLLSLLHIIIIMVYSAVSPALNIWQNLQRFNYKYILVTFITVCINVGATIVSLCAVLFMKNKLQGRILGYQIPLIIANICIFAYLTLKSKHKFSLYYCRYALKISAPMTIHLVSGMILNSVDKVMINYIVGAEKTAMYSVAYTVAMMEYILIMSMNDAFSPWLGEMLNENNPKRVNKFSSRYVILFALVLNLVFLLAPEILYIFGGENYMEAIWVIPLVVLGYFFYFLYTMFVDIEQLCKKTGGIAMGTGLAAIVNVILNWIFINQFGYAAAAYTTLFSYILLFLFHFILVKKMQKTQYYNIKVIVVIAIIESLAMFATMYLYTNPILRYIFLCIYMMFLLAILFKHRKTIFLLVFKR